VRKGILGISKFLEGSVYNRSKFWLTLLCSWGPGVEIKVIETREVASSSLPLILLMQSNI
jgi:hypothetical protein